MRIAGLNPFTLSDFPGRMAAIVFTRGCNFRCPFCHNGALIEPAAEADPLSEADVFAFLQKRRGRLDGAVISGGEPTLHDDLPDFCGRIKAMGFQVKLDTNGTRPEMLDRLIRGGLVDFVAMDVKAPLAEYDRLAGVSVAIEKLCASMFLLADSGVEHEFRTTVVEPLLSAEDIRTIQSEVPAGSPHRLQAFKAELAFNPALREGDARLSADDLAELQRYRPYQPGGKRLAV